MGIENSVGRKDIMLYHRYVRVLPSQFNRGACLAVALTIRRPFT